MFRKESQEKYKIEGDGIIPFVGLVCWQAFRGSGGGKVFEKLPGDLWKYL